MACPEQKPNTLQTFESAMYNNIKINFSKRGCKNVKWFKIWSFVDTQCSGSM